MEILILVVLIVSVVIFRKLRKDQKKTSLKIISNGVAAVVIGAALFITLIISLFAENPLPFIAIGSGIILGVLALNRLVIVPTNYFAFPTRLEEKIVDSSGKVRTVEAGPSLVWPLIDDVTSDHVRFRGLNKDEVLAKAMSGGSEDEKAEVTMTGFPEWEIDDPDVNVLAQLTAEDGVRTRVQSVMGIICGQQPADHFIREREHIERIMRCALQLERLPHLYVNDKEIDDPENPGQKKKVKVMGQIFRPEVRCDLDRDKFDGWLKKLEPTEIPADGQRWNIPLITSSGELDILEFFKQNASKIQLMLDIETYIPHWKSEVERLYGIDVRSFRLNILDFAPEVKAAMQKKRIARDEMKGAKEKTSAIKTMHEDLKDAIKDDTERTNVVERASGADVKRRVISVVGGKDAGILAAADLIGGGKEEKR